MSSRAARVSPAQEDARPIIVWFRRDLRLQDNSAFAGAYLSGRPIVPVYVRDDAPGENFGEGAASRWWLHHSLAALTESLAERGLRLILRIGNACEELRSVATGIGAGALYWNFRYEPAAVREQQAVESWANSAGLKTHAFTTGVLFDPATIRNRQGSPFKVFSAYWRHVSSLSIPKPVKLSAKPLTAPKVWPKSVALADFALLPKIGWADGWEKIWRPGELGAQGAWRQFVKKIEAYDEARDLPGVEGSSTLSPHLHFGEIGPRQIFELVRELSRGSGVFPVHGGAQKFLAEVGWREFAYYLLHYFPETPSKPFHGAFAKFPWAPDPEEQRLRAWQRGRTGYPIVDAGMRQLWATGWLPNRVRMIAASFLVKHLLQPWQLGAAWFSDTLIDADLANNTLGWQWIAGCGADAAPFFRVFAPVTQAEKFDAKGEYVRRWLPELAQLPDKYVQAPWTASAEVLAKAGVILGETYPRPIVDHAKAREAALDAFQKMRK